jgi:hypothetical protein
MPNINIENLGVIPDPRPEEEKKRDWKAEELFSFPLIEWRKKSESEMPNFPIFYQDYSSSCVAQAVAKAVGIENWIEEGKFIRLSARHPYSQRSNKPGLGMYFLEGLKLGSQGITFEQLMPSQGLDESLMNDASDKTPIDDIVSKPARGGAYLQISNASASMEEIASIVEGGKPVVLGVQFGDNEWDREAPQILVDYSNAKYGHCILIPPKNATLYQGKKAFRIEDSWGETSGKKGRRYLTEDWFKASRISFAGYYQFLSNTGTAVGTKPQHQFNVDLKQGTSSEEVVWLKKCLNYMKMFPDGEFTPVFEGATLYAVQLFQKQYQAEISTIVFYQIACTGNVFSGTRQWLNKLFA